MVKHIKKWFLILLALIFFVFSLSSCAATANGELDLKDSTSTDSSIESQPDEDSVEQSYQEGVENWGKPSTLEDHYNRHGEDVDAKSIEHYAWLAYEMYKNQENFMVKKDNDGLYRIYDEDKNIFGAYNKDGTTRTFFAPSAGIDYFSRQPGELIYE